MKNQSLHVVASCPLECGMCGVVALLTVPGRKLILFSPCCGSAWPANAELQFADTSTAIELSGEVEPASLDDVSAAKLGSIGTVSVAPWASYIPGFRVSEAD